MAEVKRGLEAIRQFQKEQKEKQEAANRPKGEWFKWPKNVSTAEVRFLQEFDESSPEYKSECDLALVVVEHNAPGPEGYKRRALCTLESEGQCYACERHSLDYKEGWRQKQNLYINALVKFEGSNDVVKVIISRNANSSFAQALIEEAVDEDNVTASNFKVTKTGEGTTTQWLLKRLTKATPFDDAGVEVFNLNETAIRTVEYDKQAEYYGAVYSGPESTPESLPASDSSSDEAW